MCSLISEDFVYRWFLGLYIFSSLANNKFH